MLSEIPIASASTCFVKLIIYTAMKKTYQIPQIECVAYLPNTNVLQTVSGRGPSIGTGGGNGETE